VRLELEHYAGAKRPTNLSVRGDLIDAARAARVNLSALLERALAEELVRLKWRRWREENGPAVAAYNRYVIENGAFCRIGLRWGCHSSPFT
jgi:antitoxin CcdA